jgi:hypothetical protein
MTQTVLYHVAPRYTPGSPALVDYETAKRVAREERAAADADAYADGDQKDVEGIAYSTLEIRGTVYVTDFLTGQSYRVPVAEWSGGHWYARTDRAKFLATEMHGFKRATR